MNHRFPEKYIQQFDQFSDLVFLETGRVDAENYRSWFFSCPVAVLSMNQLADLPWLFWEIERYLSQGYYLAGYFTYECGYHFVKPESTQGAGLASPSGPLAWFGVYTAPAVFNHCTGLWEEDFPDPPGLDAPPAPGVFEVDNLEFTVPHALYEQNVNRIKDYIRAGDAYQVNYTAKCRFHLDGSSAALYDWLRTRQTVSYAAYVRTDSLTVLSFSPELFFRRDGSRITAKPMKGTMARGKTLADDERMAQQLQQDPKNRAENLMIVDLLRNDLGRIAATGSVHVPEMFTIERYQTLLQMTSTITATLPPEISYYEIFQSLFPCGSVTGAPKIRAMEIIHELETGPRGIYTGAIGYFAPERRAVFNVPIRTLVLSGDQGEIGMGSGIVYDSDPEVEYQECILKINFLTAQQPCFQLIETLLWDNGYPFLAKHGHRLQSSAAYFDYPLSILEFTNRLETAARSFQAGLKYKVRLTLDRFGQMDITSQEIGPDDPSQIHTIKISSIKTHTDDRFLYHKTTHRSVYDQAYREGVGLGVTDVIFRNQAGEITEGAISNLIIERNGRFMTPPVSCGLLNGVYRTHLLETHTNLEERVITEADMRNADRIYICNAVRGMRRVIIA